MQFGNSRFYLFACTFALLIWFDIASCAVAIHRRGNGVTGSADATAVPSRAHNGSPTTITFSSPTSSGPTITDTAVVSSQGSATSTIKFLVIPTSAMNLGNGTGNSSLITYSGGLPIQPRVTPGLAAAGVILLLVGLPYCLVGIKKKRLQIFFSTAYLCSLGVTVLIVYVMNPPVSHGVEGGYVVASTVTGLFFGGMAVVFPEVTETLGCILGGFCLSMWFLVLKPGGLLQTAYGKLIMIGVFCAVIFALSFHRLTRPYALIFSLSFSGATSMVLGIDCFSRAGLKEFWLYIWDLNDNLFPVNTYTYPHTRGMRVEIAVIVLLTAVGIMSQVKLWKILKERRQIQKAQQRQKLADIEALDEDVGRKIAERDKEEREKWEKTFGNKVDEVEITEHEKSTDSDTSKETKRESSEAGDTAVGSKEGDQENPVENGKIEVVETEEMKKERENYIQMTDITVPGAPQEDPTEEAKESEADPLSKAEQSHAEEDTPQPLVLNYVHTPYLPELEEDVMSLATFADTLQEDSFEGEGHKRVSVFSMRSIASRNDMLNIVEEDDEKASSLNVTCDPMDDNDDQKHADEQKHTDEQKGVSPENEAQRQDDSMQTTVHEEQAADGETESPVPNEGVAGIEITVSISDRKDSKSRLSSASDTCRRSSSVFSGAPSKKESDAGLLPEQQSTTSKAAGSTSHSLSELASQAPAYSTKVFKTYRTNEWAKHLADAEEPQFEDLSTVEQPNIVKEELPVPVRYMQLQETATSRSTPSRSVSKLSVYEPDNESSPSINFAVANSPPISRPVSKLALRESEVAAAPISFGVNAPPIHNPAPSVPTIPERGAATPVPGLVPVLVPNSQLALPTQSRSKTPIPSKPYGGNTLLSKRQSMIRSRPSFNTLDQVSAPQIAITSPPAISNQTSSQEVSISPRKLDDNMSLSERRNELKQQALQSRRSSLNSPSPTPPSPTEMHNRREQALKTWRESIKADPQIKEMQHQLQQQRSVTPDSRRTLDVLLERQQVLMAGKQREENAAQWHGFVEQRMRQPDMLTAHREAMRRLQANANKAI